MIHSELTEHTTLIRVLHCVASLHPGHGGPSRTVVGLTDALARQRGASVQLLSQAYKNDPAVASSVASVGRYLAFSSSRLAIKLGFPIRTVLHGLGSSSRPDLMHSHGLWLPANHWTAHAAKSWGIPLVIHPRGMLEPWALAYRSLKKRLALALFQGADLASAKVFVASSDLEYENLRAFGLDQPVAVIPNGVDEVAVRNLPKGQQRNTKKERIALFLSRVHPIKGLMELVQAWADVDPSGWRLRIAGPNGDGHWAEVARLVARLGLEETVDYLGPLDAEGVAESYREADLFVLPTFSENFGLVVAEALAHGVPVITTRGAPWADLEKYRCGWWIETGTGPLTVALREAMALTDAERAAMGERGRVYSQRYDWNSIAGQTLELYRWMLGRGERPVCVRLD